MNPNLRIRVLRIAAALPAGNHKRKAILAMFTTAMEHPSEKARKEYLKDHPAADPGNHTVKEDGGGPGGGSGPSDPESKWKAQDAEAKKLSGEARDKVKGLMDKVKAKGVNLPKQWDHRTYVGVGVGGKLLLRHPSFGDRDISKHVSGDEVRDAIKADDKASDARNQAQEAMKAWHKSKKATDIRSRALRTADALPVGNPMRRAILAMVERLARSVLEIGKTVETDHLRVHRYRDSLRITDLTFAGKRGRTVDILAVTDIDYLSGNDLAVAKFERWLSKVVSGVAFSDAERSFQALLAELSRGDVYPLPKLHRSQEKGIRVDPPQSVMRRVKFTVIDTPKQVLTVEAKPSDVSIREIINQVNDRGERQFYLHDTVVSNTNSRPETQTLYNWVAENEDKLKRVKSLVDVRKMLDAEGVPYRQFYLD